MKVTEKEKESSKKTSDSENGSRKSKSEIKHNRREGAKKRMSGLSPIRKRQYKHVLESELEEGKSRKAAERIAMATTNKTRKEKGET